MLTKKIEILVGLFIIAAVCALFILAFKMSGLTRLPEQHYYTINAEFDNIGDLKTRAPVTIAGVVVGQVKSITLDSANFRANVELLVSNHENNLPIDTSASILTQGLLGSNYISLSPGYSDQLLKSGDALQTTHSALILENLIGQLMYSLKGDSIEPKKKGESL